MDSVELEKTYRENSLDDAAKIVGVSVPTLLRRVKAAGIELKGSGRPYKNNKCIYMSTSNRKLLAEHMSLESAGLFYMLATDKDFIQNNWNGLSGVNINELESDYLDKLSILKEGNIISEFEIVNGLIKTEIINRQEYVLTEDEYVKLENN